MVATGQVVLAHNRIQLGLHVPHISTVRDRQAAGADRGSSSVARQARLNSMYAPFQEVSHDDSGAK